MMTVTLVLPLQIADELLHAVANEIESAGVLLAKLVKTPAGDMRLLARAMHWVPDDAYQVRNSRTLSISSHGYIPALAAAEADEAVPIWLHTHPGYESTPRPSEYDEIVDQELLTSSVCAQGVRITERSSLLEQTAISAFQVI